VTFIKRDFKENAIEFNDKCVAYFKGQEVKQLTVSFDGDDYTIFDRTNKQFLKDEHGCSFFGLDKAEDLITSFCLKLKQ
jgi:hypothetical protein